MESHISDSELLHELQRRIDSNKKALEEQTALLAQLRAVNEKLLLSERLKTNFLSNIRNEINNPVASVLELSKAISEENLGEAQIRKFARLIYNDVFSLDFQLRNILHSAEIEAGECAFAPVAINIASVIDNVIGHFAHQVAKKQIRLTVNNRLDREIIFYTDPEKLHLVLSNLLSNAIQFNHEQGSVTVDARMEGEQLLVSVSDNGPGIKDEHKQLIFDRFKQIEEGSTKTYGGRGLGLAITKALLEAIDGEIAMESETGRGSTFTIRVNGTQGGEYGGIFSSDGNDFLFNDTDNLIL